MSQLNIYAANNRLAPAVVIQVIVIVTIFPNLGFMLSIFQFIMLSSEDDVAPYWHTV